MNQIYGLRPQKIEPPQAYTLIPVHDQDPDQDQDQEHEEFIKDTSTSNSPSFGASSSHGDARRPRSWSLATTAAGVTGDGSVEGQESDSTSFSWVEYLSFFWVGIAMMWTWTMILVAVPYFQHRFSTSKWILTYFEAFNLVVFAITVLGVTIGLTRPQKHASYPKRLMASFLTCMGVSMLLALSTLSVFNASSIPYFVFLEIMVFFSALANALSRNAAFALAAGFGKEVYTQAIVTGEAVAGILPCVIQIVSVLLIPKSHTSKHGHNYEASLAALFYFLSAVLVSLISILALYLLTHTPHRRRRSHDDGEGPHHHHLKSIASLPVALETPQHPVPLRHLWSALAWPASANFITLCISSIFPVFTSRIVSIVPPKHAPKILKRDAFIPLAFGCWNLGDLIGSLLTAVSLPLVRKPRLIFLLSVARVAFIPLYRLCNIDGKGAGVHSDFFYLGVQVLSGVSDGWLGGLCMVGVTNWVGEGEREAAGAFMGASLVAGLTAGSLMSFAAA